MTHPLSVLQPEDSQEKQKNFQWEFALADDYSPHRNSRRGVIYGFEEILAQNWPFWNKNCGIRRK